MQVRQCILLGVFLGFFFHATAQSSTIYTEPNAAYQRGVQLFNEGLFGLAQVELEAAICALRPVNEPEWQEIKTSAALYYVRCAVRLDQSDAEKKALDFLRDQVPDPIAGQAALEIGDYYFGKKAYAKALVYYEMAPATGLSGMSCALRPLTATLLLKNLHLQSPFLLVSRSSPKAATWKKPPIITAAALFMKNAMRTPKKRSNDANRSKNMSWWCPIT